jgi:RNA polymerase sigma factor (sigma-70 family)
MRVARPRTLFSGRSPMRAKLLGHTMSPEIEPGTPASDRGDAALSDDLGGSFERLFRTEAPQLLRFLARRTGRREDAADLLQEIFLRFIRVARGRPAPHNPEAYLQTIASNLVRNRARQALTRSDHLHVTIDDETLADDRPDAHRQLEARQMLALYEAALARLKPKTREVFLRHRRDGLTYNQIASELNQSVSNVEKHMMKAIAHLDRTLGRL